MADGSRDGAEDGRRPARVDVLVPVYNAERTVRDSIASIQEGTFRDIRIVLVDDGSTDATSAILADIASVDRRVEVLSQPNGGIVAALNAGLAACTAPLVARFDADDLAFPERIARQVAYLDAHPDCVAVGCNIEKIDGDGRLTGERSDFAGDVRPDPHSFPAIEPYIMHPFLLVRRDAMVAAGGYRFCLHSEDTDLYWRLLPFGRLHNLPEILGRYRHHPGSVSNVSALNGRVNAVDSQLAALSFLRREAGTPDLAFPPEARVLYREAGTLARIVALASSRLEPREIGHLEAAAPAKLLELLQFREFDVEPDDYRTCTGLIARHLARLAPAHQRHLVRLWCRAVVREAKRRRFRHVAALWSPALAARIPLHLPSIALRFAMRRAGIAVPA